MGAVKSKSGGMITDPRRIRRYLRPAGPYQTVFRSSPSLTSPYQLDVPERVNPGVEVAADDGRGLVLDDDGRAFERRARRERGALVDRDLDELGAFRVEHGAAACRGRAI